MPLFEYADLVWGDKHNITLTSSLQVLQNKAAKVILNRPLYSSSTEALAVLKWLPLEKRRFPKTNASIQYNTIQMHQWPN